MKKSNRPAGLANVKISPEAIEAGAKEKELIETKEAKVPKEIILDHTTDRLGHIVEDENYQKKKWRLFAICTLSSICGIISMFYAMGVTVLFEENEFSVFPVVLAVLFFLPFFGWLYTIYFPDNAEKTKRSVIHLRRKINREINAIRFRWMTGIDEDEYQRKIQAAIDEEAEYQRNLRARLGGNKSTSQRDSDRVSSKNESERRSTAIDGRKQSGRQLSTFEA